jgi:branched-chain amino acid transport system substrate-binding protein
MKLTRRDFTAGLAVGITAPYVIGSARAQGATIKIGMCVPVTGPAAEQGLWAQNGAKLALAAVNKAGGVLGKQVELVIEDDQTTNPGIVLAFSKLAAQDDIVAFLGSIRSTQVHAMAPDVLKLGKPVMIGGTDPNLTHMGNQWLFRFRPNDSYSGRVIADYGVNTLWQEKWADRSLDRRVRHRRRQGAADALVKLGTPAVLDQGYANQSQDFTPVVLASSNPAPTFSAPTSPSKTISAFSPASCASSASTSLGRLALGRGNITALKLAGPALYGTYGVADYAEDSSDASKAFGKAYRDAYKVAPDNQSPGPMTPSPWSCRRRSTRPARPIRPRSARPSWR